MSLSSELKVGRYSTRSLPFKALLSLSAGQRNRLVKVNRVKEEKVSQCVMKSNRSPKSTELPEATWDF